MRFVEYLGEEYFGRYGGISNRIPPYEKTEIFKNPNRKELFTYNTIRFMVDIKAGDIYVWNSEILHDAMSYHLDALGVYNEYPYSSEFIWGEAGKANGKMKIIICRNRFGKEVIEKTMDIIKRTGITL